jgi:hypothetical protein
VGDDRPAREPEKRSGLSPLATYCVHVQQQDAATDNDVVAALTKRQTAIETKLTTRAARQLGPAFRFEIGAIERGSSVLVIAAVGTPYGVPVTSTLIAQLVAFSTTVQAQIGNALSLGGIDAQIDVAVEPQPEAATEASGFWGLISPILAAVATGIGVVGFATFIGGAVQYGRFAGAGLPPEEAVSFVPTRTLIVLGAKTLTWAVLAGLLSGAIVLILRTVEEQQENPNAFVQKANEKRAVAIGTAIGVVELGFILFVGLDPLIAVAFAAGTVVMAGAVGVIATRTAASLWLALVVFAEVGLFTGAVEVARSWNNTTVRGAALVRNNKRAVIGFYIAESGGRVYLGQLIPPPPSKHDKTKSRIIAVDTAQVSDLAIGAPKDPVQAKEQAEELADELCLRQPRVAGTASAPVDVCWTYPPGGSKVQQRQEEALGTREEAREKSEQRLREQREHAREKTR